MSYFKKIEYRILPNGSFQVQSNCAGCGGKARFVNTGCFRVNANGSMLDVWLIYQCKKCRHTLKLSIYERKKVSAVPHKEYQRFLENDAALVQEYGQKKEFFVKNRLEIAWDESDYKYVDPLGKELSEKREYVEGEIICVRNEYGMKIRPERMTADIFGRSRSWVKRMVADGGILMENDPVKSLHKFYIGKINRRNVT